MSNQKPSFKCYFCHKKIENDTEMGHTSVCGNVLVPCPHKCGAYIPRNEIRKHEMDCTNNRLTKSMTRLHTKSEVPDESPGQSLDRRLSNHNKEVLDRLIVDQKTLLTKFNTLEQKSNTEQVLSKLQDLNYQNQVISEWKKGVDFRLQTLQTNLESVRNPQDHSNSFEEKLRILDQIQMNFNIAMEEFSKEQNYNRKANVEFAQSLDELKKIFELDRLSQWNEQKTLYNDLQLEVDNLKKNLDELKAKNISVTFDIRTISQIASETAEKLEIQEREFTKFKQNFEQMKFDLEIIENLVSAEAKVSSSGHLIWKIEEFESKMSQAKTSNTVVKSPIFYSHDFGYKIRVLVYLNGLKKWKDRYALLSIHVLKGDFDELLKWPCNIEGVVTLRDQENVENPKNFSKHIVAKRHEGDEENEEPQESSFSYIFIPHATLKKTIYLKNDTVFFQLVIEKNRKLLTETDV